MEFPPCPHSSPSSHPERLDRSIILGVGRRAAPGRGIRRISRRAWLASAVHSLQFWPPPDDLREVRRVIAGWLVTRPRPVHDDPGRWCGGGRGLRGGRGRRGSAADAPGGVPRRRNEGAPNPAGDGDLDRRAMLTRTVGSATGGEPVERPGGAPPAP